MLKSRRLCVMIVGLALACSSVFSVSADTASLDDHVIKYQVHYQLPDLDVNHNSLEVAKVGEDYGISSSSYLTLLADSESLRATASANLATYVMEVGWNSEQSYNRVA